MTENSIISAEDASVTGWQDRGWVIGVASAVAAMIALTAIGLSFWVAALVAGLLFAAGGVVSTHTALARLDEATRRRHMRSIAIGLILAALVVMFYAATIVRLGGNVMNRAM
jgi:uncharacterized membrane protein HdeD (DUF308 family)